MNAASEPIVRPVAITHGHYECRDLDETVPILSHLLAFEVVNRSDGTAVLKHPNTEWLLVVHRGPPDSSDKPQRNHYGVRVTNNAEVDRAYEYLLAKKEKLQLKKVVMRREREGSYSCFFMEPGGNYWEIESYEDRRKGGPARRDCLSMENSADGGAVSGQRLRAAGIHAWDDRRQ